jgi:hypothetical protein
VRGVVTRVDIDRKGGQERIQQPNSKPELVRLPRGEGRGVGGRLVHDHSLYVKRPYHPEPTGRARLRFTLCSTSCRAEDSRLKTTSLWALAGTLLFRVYNPTVSGPKKPCVKSKTKLSDVPASSQQQRK